MAYHRVLFRLDYEPNYKMFDSLGKTMEFLSSETIGGEKFLPDLLENKQSHGVGARHTTPGTSEVRNLTIEPAAIFGSFDIVDGADTKNIEMGRVFTKMIKIVNRVRIEFGISALKRSGLRLFFLDGINEENSLESFNGLIRKSYVSDIKNNLGDITDSGIVLEGLHADRIRFRTRIGPYFKEEAAKYFPNTHQVISQVDHFNIVADVDFYQHDFDLDYRVSYSKWCTPIFERADKAVELFKKNIMTEGD